MQNSSSVTITEPARETSQTVRTVFPGKKEISSPPLSCKISNDSDTGGFQTARASWQTCSSKSRGEVWTLIKINDAERPVRLVLCWSHRDDSLPVQQNIIESKQSLDTPLTGVRRPHLLSPSSRVRTEATVQRPPMRLLPLASTSSLLFFVFKNLGNLAPV